jgi:hypothetical protein
LNYWITLEELCIIESEKRLLGEEKLSPHQEIEEEANLILKNTNQTELETFEAEIKHHLLTNPKFAREYQYWNCLLQRVKVRLAQLKLETIIDQFRVDRADQLQQTLAELLRQENE